MILAVTLGLALVACSTKSNDGTNEDTSSTAAPTSDVSTENNESSNYDDETTNTDEVPSAEGHYYSKVVVTSTYLMVSDFIYGLTSVLCEFGVGDGSYFGYEPNFTIYYDTATGKATSAVLKAYIGSYQGVEGEINYEDLYIEAISCDSNLSEKISGFSKEVVEYT